jgi:hypothetical protein
MGRTGIGGAADLTDALAALAACDPHHARRPAREFARAALRLLDDLLAWAPAGTSWPVWLGQALAGLPAPPEVLAREGRRLDGRAYGWGLAMPVEEVRRLASCARTMLDIEEDDQEEREEETGAGADGGLFAGLRPSERELAEFLHGKGVVAEVDFIDALWGHELDPGPIDRRDPTYAKLRNRLRQRQRALNLGLATLGTGFEVVRPRDAPVPSLTLIRAPD